MTAARTLAFLAAAVAGAGPASGAEADPLGRYRWTSRVLVIAAPDAGDARLAAQREAVAAGRAGMAERDLVVVEAVGPGAGAMSLRRRFALPADAFRAVLVGKDGELKMAESEPIPAASLFSVIDAMPMRRDEMRRR